MDARLQKQHTGCGALHQAFEFPYWSHDLQRLPKLCSMYDILRHSFESHPQLHKESDMSNFRIFGFGVSLEIADAVSDSFSIDNEIKRQQFLVSEVKYE